MLVKLNPLNETQMPSRRIRVKVSRIYEYPFCVLDKLRPFDDALTKAQENLAVDINHIVNNRFENANQLFTAEVTEEPMVPKTKNVEGDDFKPEITINYAVLLDKLVNSYIDEKYGELSFAVHPEFYQTPRKGKTALGEEVELSPRLKDHIHDEINQTRVRFRDMIDTSEMKIDL